MLFVVQLMWTIKVTTKYFWCYAFLNALDILQILIFECKNANDVSNKMHTSVCSVSADDAISIELICNTSLCYYSPETAVRREREAAKIWIYLF